MTTDDTLSSTDAEIRASFRAAMGRAVRADLNSIVVRLTSAHRLANTGILEPAIAADVFEAMQAIIEGAIRKLDACEKACGGPGTGTIG